MKQWFCLLLFLPLFTAAQETATSGLPPQTVHYSLYATLNDTAKTITAFEKLTYKNNTQKTLAYIWFRLYPNAYASDRTAYSDYLLQKGDLHFYFSDESKKGNISQLNFQSEGKELKTFFDTTQADKIQVWLLQPLKPGDSVSITTPFLLKLPYNFSGFGYLDSCWQLRHWYPEVAPLIKDKWSLKPFKGYEQVKSCKADFEVSLFLKTEHNIHSNGRLISVELLKHNEQKRAYLLNNATDFYFSVNDTLGIKTAISGEEMSAKNNFEKLLPSFFRTKRPVRPKVTEQSILHALTGIGANPKKVLKPTLFFNLKETDKYHYLSFLPAVGFNNYDKLQLGVMMHNYQLPLSKFNFLIAPLYATNSKRLSGVGRVAYNLWKPQRWWQFSISGTQYSKGSFMMDNGGDELFQQVQKIVPAISYTHYAGAVAPRKKWNIKLRSFFLKEEFVDFSANGAGSSVAKNITQKHAVVQLQTSLSDSRALYPYSIKLAVEATRDVLRAGITAHYFLNYNADGQGLRARFFAGKFFYWQPQNTLSRFYNDRYLLSLSGVSGARDFTYSNYFIGRSEYDGWMSQQIMERDGFFKVATPMLNNEIGLSDNWLAAVNLTADIPASVNPFAVLPFRLPLRLFLDVGTYSEAWDENPATGRFLFDAGVQVSLFKDAVTVYFPLLYSKVYRDYYRQMGYKSYFPHTIKFSINLSKLKPQVLNKILPL